MAKLTREIRKISLLSWKIPSSDRMNSMSKIPHQISRIAKQISSKNRQGDATDVRFVITVPESSAQLVRNLLEILHDLGSWGSSRTVQLGWDGDGHNRLFIEDDGGLSHTLPEGQAWSEDEIVKVSD